MPASIFIPLISTLALIPSGNIFSMHSLLDAVWEKYLRLDQVKLSQLSLRTLTNPVPIEPMDTLHKRVMDSARGSAWVHTAIEGNVPSNWFDSEEVHVFLYVDQGVAMRAAENLYEKLWGQDLKANLGVVPHGKGTLNYLSKEYLDSLQLRPLGYRGGVLLFRDEYSVALESSNIEEAMAGGYRGVIITGQPGIGKSCFLYYLLLQKLSEMTSVALERPDCFFLFSDDGVTMHDKTKSYIRLFPKVTWALSDSNDKTEQPCEAFLDDSQEDRAWIVQATSPKKERWKQWRTQHSAEMFIMKYFSVEEITALGKIRGLKVEDLQRIYEQWGPSARTCLLLSRHPSNEASHEDDVKRAAADFVKFAPTTPHVNILTASHILFKMEPKGEESRQTPIGRIATDRIRDIILYAAAEAEAHERVKFYLTISKQPGFRTSAGKMFEEFVLSWFYAHSDNYIPCDATQATSPYLQIPACGGEGHTVFFSSKSALKKKTRGDTILPLLLLPTSQSFATADAIILTEEFIITIQVTIADSHKAKGSGFATIEEHLSVVTKRSRKWCHVFITDNEYSATSLRNQTFSELPHLVQIYSAVFDVGTPSILRDHVEGFNNQRQREVLEQQKYNNDNDNMEVE